MKKQVRKRKEDNKLGVWHGGPCHSSEEAHTVLGDSCAEKVVINMNKMDYLQGFEQRINQI